MLRFVITAIRLAVCTSAWLAFDGRNGVLAQPAAQSDKVKQQDTRALIPLTDLGTKEYKGFPGGLYPGGKNTRPAGHEAAGIALARHVQPLDADGKPNPDGKIVLLGIGFSNTVQAFNGFMAVAKEDNDLNPKLVLVNGAKGGRAAFMIQNPDDGRQGTDYWADVDKKLQAANVTRKQVQVVWIKETNPNPPDPGFLKFTQDLQAQLGKIVRVVQQRFPNVKLAYFSSRTYGGWAHRPGGGSPGNSEPFSYETGFAVKWLIEQQLKGEPALNYDASKGPVRAPWLSWSAYVWSNGPIKRSDGVSFELEDFTPSDHMHESPAGQRKVGRLLLQFFKTDSTIRPWFVKPPGPGPSPREGPGQPPSFPAAQRCRINSTDPQSLRLAPADPGDDEPTWPGSHPRGVLGQEPPNRPFPFAIPS
jgi:hypothetical protein